VNNYSPLHIPGRVLLIIFLLMISVVSDHAKAAFRESPYGNASGWSVDAVFDDNNFQYCGATNATRGYYFRFGFDGTEWVIGRESAWPILAHGGLDGGFEKVQLTPYGDGWAFAKIPADMVNGIRNGSSIMLSLEGESDVHFSLEGSAAALLKVEECAQRRGVENTAVRQAGNNQYTGHCPGGGNKLPLTGLCPAEASSAFMGVYNSTALAPGCTWGVNETQMAGGDVLLYRAAKCGSLPGKLEYSGGAHQASLSAREIGSTAAGLNITVRTADPADPYTSITNYVRQAMNNQQQAISCYAQDLPDGAIKVDIDPVRANALAAKGPYDGQCGSLGQRDDASHWRSFGGFVWYVEMTQDAYFSIAPESMVLLQRDAVGDGLKGWRVSY